MKLIKIFITSLFLTISLSAKAEIAEVYSWKANPGQGADMIETMVEAATIQRDLGAHVTINQLDVGSQNQIDYVIRFDSMSEWGSYRDKLQASPAWNEFWNRVGEDPNGELEMSFAASNLDSSVKSSSFSNSGVYGVWVWEVAAGKLPEVLENFANAKAIHENLGARAEYYSEGLGASSTLHYLMLFDDWSDMASFMENAANSEENQRFQANVDPSSATLVRQITGRTLPL
tara:strand:- start:62 stop:754 length:693 start_codon:yes stop_codon:yes gene_type:complete